MGDVFLLARSQPCQPAAICQLVWLVLLSVSLLVDTFGTAVFAAGRQTSVSVLTSAAGLIGQLPPRTTRRGTVHRDLRVPVSGGVELLADLYQPAPAAPYPTLLVRSPYGRRGLVGMQYGRLYAERGFQVLVQSTRGGYGSGGQLEPMSQEAADGQATVAWLRQQPWFSGKLVTIGASYMGYAAWALACAPPPELKAMVVQIAPHEWRDVCYQGGAFALELSAGWTRDVVGPPLADGVVRSLVDAFRPGRDTTLRPALRELPLAEAGRQTFGRDVAFFREWLDHPPADPFWQARDATEALAQVDVPVLLLGGWQDLFLRQTVEQYQLLTRRSVPTALTVGPWTHLGVAEAWALLLRESLAFLQSVFAGGAGHFRESPVRVYVGGAGTWRDLPTWPPPGSWPQLWHLQPQGGLARAEPVTSAPDRYVYDPAAPTPSVGGPTLWDDAGVRDNRGLESRPDVLTYTSEVLTQDLQVGGDVTAELYVRSSRAHSDVFARLCDVDAAGRSWNVTDGICRLEPGRPSAHADGTLLVVVDLGPTAYRFRLGHRLRLQVSSGAHPRFARNLGVGGTLADATEMAADERSLFHDPPRPSRVVLPVEQSVGQSAAV